LPGLQPGVLPGRSPALPQEQQVLHRARAKRKARLPAEGLRQAV